MKDSVHLANAETKSVQAHTPGPWHQGVDGNNRVYGSACQGDETGLIAIVYKGRANVRLVTAAPELLASAVEFDRLLLVIESAVRYSDPQNHPAIMRAINANRAAIVKATAA